MTGYLFVWFVFDAFATVFQAGLHHAALLSPSMASASPALSGRGGAGLTRAAGVLLVAWGLSLLAAPFAP